jgi:hypothetical protein
MPHGEHGGDSVFILDGQHIICVGSRFKSYVAFVPGYTCGQEASREAPTYYIRVPRPVGYQVEATVRYTYFRP